MRNIPGRKTDQNDSEWIADLLAHGLLRASFVPPREIQELRDLTRYRVKLKGDYNRIHNRIGKVLEDANIKLGTVASDIPGVTGREIIRRIAEGKDPEWLARARLRQVARDGDADQGGIARSNYGSPSLYVAGIAGRIEQNGEQDRGSGR